MADEVGHDAFRCSHRLETVWKQALSKGSTLETVLQSLPKLWLQMFQQEREETRGQQGKERDSASFRFVISITALCWEAQEQGILVAPKNTRTHPCGTQVTRKHNQQQSFIKHMRSPEENL